MSKLVYERMRDSLEQLPPQGKAAGWNPRCQLDQRTLKSLPSNLR